MASTNQSPFYQQAERDFLLAQTDGERLIYLEKMIQECPKHKGAEKMLAQLRTRKKKLLESVEKQKKSKKGSGPIGIKKADCQCVLVGFPNSGKSTLFNLMSESKAKVSQTVYSTYQPQLGSFIFEDLPIQIVDDAPVPNYDKSSVNSTDTLLVVITKIDEIEKIEEYISHSRAKKIYLFNKVDLISEDKLRKLKARIKSNYNKLNFIFTNEKMNGFELNELKQKILKSFDKIRIYTKEPGKVASKRPMVMKPGSTVEDAAEKILKGLSKKVKQAKIWGPSSKFSGQSVGLNHLLKDKDIIEFKTS